MEYPQKIDLHMHTSVSDGTDSPEEILVTAKRAGLDLFSVTDHDDIRGCQIIRECRTEEDPLFISGVEFSCEDENGKYHILGYGYDPGAGSVQQVVQHSHDYRMQKIHGRLAGLKEEFGIVFSEEEVQKLMSLYNPGKPHIGNLMIRHGYAKTLDEAIHGYLDRLHVPSPHIHPEMAIWGILEGGGIPVLAHPSYGDGDQLIVGTEMEERLRHLIRFGLQGLEAYYSGFTKRLIRELCGYAETFGLYITAGSDYHGGNKLIRAGDTNLNAAADAPDGLRRFLETVLETAGNSADTARKETMP